MTARATVTYGLDADASLVARAADRALEGCGVHAAHDSNGDVRIARRGQSHYGPGVSVLRPGQQLLVERDGTWRIEATS